MPYEVRGRSRAAAWCGRLLLFAALIVGIVGMHTLGHPVGGHGSGRCPRHTKHIRLTTHRSHTTDHIHTMYRRCTTHCQRTTRFRRRSKRGIPPPSPTTTTP